MVILAQKLLEKAKPYFQEYTTLSASCPKCGTPLVLKYASNPGRYMRQLSIIVACKKQCDKRIWNTNAKEGFTHWWLDGLRDREGYERIVQSLPIDERKLIRQLEKQVREINEHYFSF